MWVIDTKAAFTSPNVSVLSRSLYLCFILTDDISFLLISQSLQELRDICVNNSRPVRIRTAIYEMSVNYIYWMFRFHD